MTETIRPTRAAYIYESLRREIETGVYPTGVLLPSESKLSRRYHVQRDTVRRALTLLVRDGLIVKRRGLGSYVRPASELKPLTIDPAFLNSPLNPYLLMGGSDGRK